MSQDANGHSAEITIGIRHGQRAVKRPLKANDTNETKKLKKHPKSIGLKNTDLSKNGGTKCAVPETCLKENFVLPRYCPGDIMEKTFSVCDVDAIIKEFEKSHKLILCHTKINNNMAEELADGISSLPPRFVLEELKLRNCSVNDNTLKILLNAIGTRKVISLDLSANTEMNSMELSRFIKSLQPEKLDLSECKLKWTHYLEKVFSETKLQVKSLNISHYGFVDTSLSKVLVQILSSHIQELILVDSSITSQHLEETVKCLPSKIHLNVLDVSGNDLDERSITALAKIVTSAKSMRKLGMSDCGLTTSLLEAFHMNVDAKVAETDLSDNNFLEETCWKVIVDTIKKLTSETVLLSNCNIKYVKTPGKATFDRVHIKCLDLGDNPGIDPLDVGKLALRWKLAEVRLNNCGLQPDDFKNFEKGLYGHILERLDISELAEIPSEEKLRAVENMRRRGKVAKNITFKHLKPNHSNGWEYYDI